MDKDALRERFAAEIERQGRDMKELSIASGLGETYVRDFLKRGRGKVENLYAVAAQLGHGPEWIAQDAAVPRKGRGKIVPVRNALGPVDLPEYGPPLPVLGVARGSRDGSDGGRIVFNGTTLETIPRPPVLMGVDGAYACYVIGDSMRPRFRQGEKVWVHPRRPPVAGDGVIVQLYPDEDGDPPEGYIKEFVRLTSSVLVLKQFDPEGEFEIERPLVMSIHVIVGSLYV